MIEHVLRDGETEEERKLAIRRWHAQKATQKKKKKYLKSEYSADDLYLDDEIHINPVQADESSIQRYLDRVDGDFSEIPDDSNIKARIKMQLHREEFKKRSERIKKGLIVAKKEGKLLGRKLGCRDKKKRDVSGYIKRYAGKTKEERKLGPRRKNK